VDRDRPDGGRLIILLDRDSLLAKIIQIEDEQGDLTQITLSNLKVNLDLPSAVKGFTLPHGTRLNRLKRP
jgi:outer membrane lipoprotein-sorting protein